MVTGQLIGAELAAGGLEVLLGGAAVFLFRTADQIRRQLREQLGAGRKAEADALALYKQINHPELGPEHAEALAAVADLAASASSATRYRGELFADQLRKQFVFLPDGAMAAVILEVLNSVCDADDIDAALLMVAAAAAELSSLERELTP